MKSDKIAGRALRWSLGEDAMRIVNDGAMYSVTAGDPQS